MQTFKNNTDARLREWPQSPQEWQASPVIKFTVPGNRIVHVGDRIHAATKMVKTGLESGGVKDIYYYIQEIKEVKANAVFITDTDITATAKRLEV
ncbi:hypothetical protein GR160_02995 [Flavobacterium sp. Sd200]|uniref:hypothetical protein n=1 Tax=Flavobacterium sp. Sd200 TaxID=2692211 RepID=UPI00136F123F|nr:hypothetical protein [Flavobacterium sp. Sd200]MXN90181.1 hypothetical protein [Flavobacterium sp. Sd200]